MGGVAGGRERWHQGCSRRGRGCVWCRGAETQTCRTAAPPAAAAAATTRATTTASAKKEGRILRDPMIVMWLYSISQKVGDLIFCWWCRSANDDKPHDNSINNSNNCYNMREKEGNNEVRKMVAR